MVIVATGTSVIATEGSQNKSSWRSRRTLLPSVLQSPGRQQLTSLSGHLIQMQKALVESELLTSLGLLFNGPSLMLGLPNCWEGGRVSETLALSGAKSLLLFLPQESPAQPFENRGCEGGRLTASLPRGWPSQRRMLNR